MECVKFSEQTQTRYTGDNWELQYYNTNYFDAGKEEEVMKYIKEKNSKPVVYSNLKEIGDPYRRRIHECELLRMDDAVENITVKYHKWNPNDHTLELHAERDFEETERNVQRTEYINLLLFFERVVFEEEATAGAKRARSD